MWWLLTGCLAPFLEAPFVLAPGVDAVQLSLDREGNLLAALGEQGAVRVDGEGHATVLWSEATYGVSGLPNGDFFSWDRGRVQHRDAAGNIIEQRALAGLRDAAGWCGTEAYLLDGVGVHAWQPAEDTLVEVWAQPDLQGLVFVACDRALGWSETQLLSLPDGEVLAEPEPPLRAAAARRDGTVYLLHGESARISRLEDDGRLTIVASHPGDARDAVFGYTGLISDQNVYLANPGSLDYLRPL